MGQEISLTHFKHYDFHRFDKLVEREMEVLRTWFREGRFSARQSVAGLELEAWLVDAEGRPVPWNEQVITRHGSPDVVPELSRFNLEFNVAPRTLGGNGVDELMTELAETWRACDAAASTFGASVVAIGILPTLSESMLSLANMSKSHRFQALNEQILRLRQGRPLRLQISGRQQLATEHHNVMLEAATTSFQLHRQVPFLEAARYLNAAILASAAMVAVAGNSPLLFGKLLWEETRIPLFEQAVDVGGGSQQRVTFGSGYAHDSLEELFCENHTQYPVLLPLVMDQPSERLAHIRLHNGTIWRWNRPLIGFDDDGKPHLRVEHRVMAAGPTLADMTANMALYYGLTESLARESPPPESRLPFAQARENFYRAARDGLNCELHWIDGSTHPLPRLLIDELLPRAEAGLQRLSVDASLAGRLLELLEERIRCGQTAAVWQRRFFEEHGRDAALLARTYRDHQQQGAPAHTWTLQAQPKGQRVTLRPSMLRIVAGLPAGLLEATAAELADLLGGPTLIHFDGRQPRPLFVSILLHGNEDVGLRAVQSWLREYGDPVLPRALSLFVGNVDAARQCVRTLPGQPDYNRIWPGCMDDGTPEHAMMRHIVDEMRQRGVFASIDLHNNTGLNPYYTCVSRLASSHLQLASLFGRTVVYFRRPLGVQARALAELCPAVTCECGRAGDQGGVRRATAFLDACLRLNDVPHSMPVQGEIHLFHTVATIYIPPRVTFTFVDNAADCRCASFDLTLRRDLERLNFRQLEPGTCLGWSRFASALPLSVIDQSGNNVTGQFLAVEEGAIRLRRSMIPAMFTDNRPVIRQDCLGYLMEQFDLAASQSAEASR